MNSSSNFEKNDFNISTRKISKSSEKDDHEVSNSDESKSDQSKSVKAEKDEKKNSTFRFDDEIHLQMTLNFKLVKKTAELGLTFKQTKLKNRTLILDVVTIC